MPLRAVRALEGRTSCSKISRPARPSRSPPVDDIVVAAGGVAEDGLSHALRGRVPDVRMVGDCVAPRTALAAVFEGHAAGRAL
jgi:dimethylglycine catabolism A